MLNTIIAAFLLFTLVLQSCKYQVALATPSRNNKDAGHQKVAFFTDALISRLDSAKLAGRPVFLDFYTTWCGPCKVMDRDVFTDSELATYLNENFVSLKVNAEKGEGIGLARKFEIKGYPTLVFLDASGAEQERVLGMTTAKRLQKMGEQVGRSK